MKVVVIGAGIVGANVAWRLTQKGASVTVVEAKVPGSDTSGNSFAWVNSHRKPPRSYHDLNVRGMQAHRDLCREFPDQTWWGGKGGLEWSRAEDSASEFEARISASRAWDYSAEIIDRKRLATLAPDVDACAFPDRQVALFEDEGWVSPALLIDRLLRAAQERGATLLTMTGPASLVIDGDRATGIRLASGLVEADAVVNCTGRHVNSVVEDEALHIPMGPSLGLLVVTAPVPTHLEHVLIGPECDVRAERAGMLMLHSTDFDHQLSPDTSHEQLCSFGVDLVARARKLLPSINEMTVETVRVGTRAYPADGLTVVGGLPGLEHYTIAATHSGVTMSPWLGHAIADEVFDGTIHDELADFRPARFFGDSASKPRVWIRD